MSDTDRLYCGLQTLIKNADDPRPWTSFFIDDLGSCSCKVHEANVPCPETVRPGNVLDDDSRLTAWIHAVCLQRADDQDRQRERSDRFRQSGLVMFQAPDWFADRYRIPADDAYEATIFSYHHLTRVPRQPARLTQITEA